MTAATILALGKSLNDADLSFFYGASDSVRCTVTITLNDDGSATVTKTGDCSGVRIKAQ